MLVACKIDDLKSLLPVRFYFFFPLIWKKISSQIKILYIILYKSISFIMYIFLEIWNWHHKYFVIFCLPQFWEYDWKISSKTNIKFPSKWKIPAQWIVQITSKKYFNQKKKVFAPNFGEVAKRNSFSLICVLFEPLFFIRTWKNSESWKKKSILPCIQIEMWKKHGIEAFGIEKL